jgi:hypothetical protein
MANLRTRLRRLEAMAGRRGDEIPIGELSPYEGCCLALFIFRPIWVEQGWPPSAPSEARVAAVQQALHASGPDRDETLRCFWAEFRRWLEGLPPVGEDR